VAHDSDAPTPVTAAASQDGTRGRRAARPKLATQVRAEILGDITAGRWRPGDRLPTEVELMARFGVSRAPIREAMQSLHLMGIVDISPRRGATVRALPVQSVVDMAMLSGSMRGTDRVGDVFEFRDAMEGAIAELSARNASDGQIDIVRGIIEENRAAVSREDWEEAQRIDVRFHAAIAEASGNVVFTAVAAALNGLLVELRRATGGIPGASAASLVEHEEILAALGRRDGPAARRATERHIRNSRARYESARAAREAARPPAPEPPRPRSSGAGRGRHRA
jgi:GntR family transcriptional regulator, transcriptional repressor for pyruvate dehydrogenase complex